MASFLPPYSKKHIFILGSLTLAASIYLLLLTSFSIQNPLNPDTTNVSAQELKEGHTEALDHLSNNNPDGALIAERLLIIDLRSKDEFLSSHITGAENLSPANLKGALFSSDLTIILYGKNSETIEEAKDVLSEYELASVKVLQDDITALEDQGYPITYNNEN